MRCGDFLEKDSVPGHGEIDARRAEDVLVGRAQDREEDDEGDERGADRPDGQVHGVAGDAIGLGDGPDGKHVEVGQVGDDVKTDDAQRAQQDPQGEVPLRPLDLTQAVGRGLPALVSPEHGDQGDPEIAQEAGIERPRGRGNEVGRVPLGEDEDDARDRHQGDRLDDRQGVLQVRPRPDADVVHGRKEDDDADGDRLDHERAQVEKVGQVFRGKSHGQRGDGPRIDDQEEGPAEKEGRERPVGFAEENVHSTGLGHGRTHLGESQGAEEAEQAADDPDREHQERRRDIPGDRLGD